MAQTGMRVKAEFNHPILAKTIRPGRKPQIDFGWFKDQDGTPEQRRVPQLLGAVETKWLGNGEPSPPEVVWDVMRLELLASHLNIEAYFVMAGFRKKIDSLFESPDFLDRRSSQPLLPTVATRHAQVFDLRSMSPRVEKSLAIYREKYGDVAFPETVTVHPPHISVPANGGHNLSFAVYTWKISPREKSGRESLAAHLKRKRALEVESPKR